MPLILSVKDTRVYRYTAFMNSILKSYGIPEELIDYICLWAHRLSYDATLQEIKAHKGLTTKNKIAVWPRVVYNSFALGGSSILDVSNLLYDLLTERL